MLMPHCANCDGYITQDFIRVFGVEGTVASCPNCATYRELANGEGAMGVN